MEEGAGVGLGAFRMDCESVLSELKSRHKQLAVKRRWLMGLPLSDSENKVFEGREFWNQSVVPESLLREDDIFYETVKIHVRGDNTNKECELIVRNFKSFDSETMNRLLSQLNYLTNKGLHHIAVVAARGSNEFHKTRQGMKKMIRETLRNLSKDEEDTQWRTEICQHLYELLHDPQFVRGNVPHYLDVMPQSTKIAALKIVDFLEDLPTSVLIAMVRKLSGLPGRVPQLTLQESERRSNVIHQVRNICLEMLSEHDDRVQLQDHLAKALAIAVLSLRLEPRSENHVVADFHQFTPEIRVLQQRIMKAIELLKSKRFPVLKKLQAVLRPGSNMPNRCLRAAISRFLAECLFECCDMDVIPSSLIEALAIIYEGNADDSVSGSSDYNPSIYDENGEVDSILGASALLKQIVLDLLPEMDYAADYSNAYAEETEESDEDDVMSHSPDNGEVVKSFHNEGSGIDYANPLAEGHGDSGAVSFDPLHCIMDSKSGYPHTTPNSAPHGGLSLDIYTGMDYSGPIVGDFLVGERNEDNYDGEKTYRNSYLTIQEACDDTSLLAYNIVDFMMKKIAKDTILYLDEGSNPDNHGRSSRKENAEGNKKIIKEKNIHEYASGTLICHAVEHLLPNQHERLCFSKKAEQSCCSENETKNKGIAGVATVTSELTRTWQWRISGRVDHVARFGVAFEIWELDYSSHTKIPYRRIRLLKRKCIVSFIN